MVISIRNPVSISVYKDAYMHAEGLTNCLVAIMNDQSTFAIWKIMFMAMMCVHIMKFILDSKFLCVEWSTLGDCCLCRDRCSEVIPDGALN